MVFAVVVVHFVHKAPNSKRSLEDPEVYPKKKEFFKPLLNTVCKSRDKYLWTFFFYVDFLSTLAVILLG